MEIRPEQVEKLTARAGVTAEEASALLEHWGGSALDALLELERQGRAPVVRGGSYSTRFGVQTGGEVRSAPRRTRSARPQWRDLPRRLWALARRALQISLEVWRKGEVMVAIPLVVLVLLFLVAPYAMVPLTLVGLVLGCRYRFSGPQVEDTPVNGALDRACDVVEQWVEQVRSEMDGPGRGRKQ